MLTDPWRWYFYSSRPHRSGLQVISWEEDLGPPHLSCLGQVILMLLWVLSLRAWGRGGIKNHQSSGANLHGEPPCISNYAEGVRKSWVPCPSIGVWGGRALGCLHHGLGSTSLPFPASLRTQVSVLKEEVMWVPGLTLLCLFPGSPGSPSLHFSSLSASWAQFFLDPASLRVWDFETDCCISCTEAAAILEPTTLSSGTNNEREWPPCSRWMLWVLCLQGFQLYSQAPGVAILGPWPLLDCSLRGRLIITDSHSIYLRCSKPTGNWSLKDQRWKLLRMMIKTCSVPDLYTNQAVRLWFLLSFPLITPGA